MPFFSFIITFLLISFAALPASAKGVLVFAAASTTDAVNEIVSLFVAEGQGHGKVSVSFASSSTLAKQIANGAPADVYISANPAWMDYLATKKAIDTGSRINLLNNQLVLIAPYESKLSITVKPGFRLAEALGGGRLALGDPAHVPAGIYAKEALTRLGVWQKLAAKVARTQDVRAALALVERGEAAAGVVYATDARIDPKVRVVATFPATSHSRIIYPAAMVAGRAKDEVVRFFNFLKSPKADAVFRRYGFGRP